MNLSTAKQTDTPEDLLAMPTGDDFDLLAGVSLVWVIDPPTRSVRVHRADGTRTDLQEDDELNGEHVLPGFRRSVREVFPAPARQKPRAV